METRQTAIAWGVGAMTWFLGLYSTGLFLPHAPLSVVFQTIIGAVPAVITTTAIELLGHFALPLAAVGIVTVVVFLAAAVGSAVWPRVRWNGTGDALLALAVLLVTGELLFASGATTVTTLLLGTAIAVAPLATFVLITARLAATPLADRRTFLRRVGVAAAGALGLGMLGTVADRVSQPTSDESGGQRLDKRDVGRTIESATPTPSQQGEKDAAFGFDFERMPARVGDISEHYIVDKDLINPAVKTDLWSLRIGGNVESSYELTYQELLDHDDRVDQIVTMVCISNEVGGNLISTVEWTGIPLVTLLERAGVKAESYDIVTRAIDDYSESIPVEAARRESILIAVGASGRRLPKDHGFPARLLIPGRYGMKSTKWLTDIEVSTRDYQGYWEQRGWEEKAVVNTLSYIRAVDVRGDQAAIGGVAYAGLRGIQRVEVSLDGGETWREAELEAPPSDLAWRRWRHVFDTPSEGSLPAVVRAVDGTGTMQTQKHTSPHEGEGGSTGWHHVDVSL